MSADPPGPPPIPPLRLDTTEDLFLSWLAGYVDRNPPALPPGAAGWYVARNPVQPGMFIGHNTIYIDPWRREIPFTEHTHQETVIAFSLQALNAQRVEIQPVCLNPAYADYLARLLTQIRETWGLTDGPRRGRKPGPRSWPEDVEALAQLQAGQPAEAVYQAWYTRLVENESRPALKDPRDSFRKLRKKLSGRNPD